MISWEKCLTLNSKKCNIGLTCSYRRYITPKTWSYYIFGEPLLTFRINLLFNPFSAGIIWKIANEKQPKLSTLNGYISKARANSETELKFSENSFKFLQSSLMLWSLYPRWLRPQPLVLLPATCGFQRVNDEPGKVLNSLFFVVFLMSGIFLQIAIFYFGQKQCFF